MLTNNTISAVMLLYEADGFEFSSLPGHPSFGDRARLSWQLISYGLLDRNGHLMRPLHSITLLDLLLALQEGVTPVPLDQAEFVLYRRNEKVNHRLGVINQLLSTQLSVISLSDLHTMLQCVE